MDIHVALLGHIILIPSQPVFALFPLYCLISGEATNINFIVFGLTRPYSIYRTRGENANHYATDALKAVILSFFIFSATTHVPTTRRHYSVQLSNPCVPSEKTCDKSCVYGYLIGPNNCQYCICSPYEQHITTGTNSAFLINR